MSYSYKIEPIDEWYTLYKKYRPYVLGRLKQLSREDREDAYQNVFISLQKAKKSYREDAGRSKSTWFFFYLKQVIDRALVRFYKEENILRLDRDNEDVRKIDIPAKSMSERELNIYAIKEIVRKLLCTIPALYAETLRSYYGIGVERKNQSELAKERHCSQTNIEDTLRIAKRYMKSRLQSRNINIGELLDYDA